MVWIRATEARGGVQQFCSRVVTEYEQYENSQVEMIHYSGTNCLSDLKIDISYLIMFIETMYLPLYDYTLIDSW